MKLFPNFTSIPFDYLLISWVTNYVSNLGFLTCLSWIVSIENSCTLLACVASVSSRGSSRKLGQEQKKLMTGEAEGNEGPFFASAVTFAQ